MILFSEGAIESVIESIIEGVIENAIESAIEIAGHRQPFCSWWFECALGNRWECGIRWPIFQYSLCLLVSANLAYSVDGIQ